MSCWNYYWGYGPALASQQRSCGPTNTSVPAVPCCVSGDTCVSDGLCHYTHPEDGGSGYYAAGCTSADFPWPLCRVLCPDDFWDVTYLESKKLWACCYFPQTGQRNCSNPTKQQFNAAAPDDLTPFYTVPYDGEVVATQPTIGTTTSESGTSPTSSHMAPKAPSSTSSALPAGAAAGIGVGAGVATMVVISYAAWFVFRRRRKERSSSLPPPSPATGTSPQSDQLPPHLECTLSGVAEDPVEPRQIPQELEDAGNGPNELPTWIAR